MKKISNLWFVVLLLFTTTIFAQVSGTVSDEMGPLSDVNVKVKGTTKGTTTDFDGKFNIANAKAGVLEFSYVGYATKEVAFKAGDKLNVTMQGSGEALSEIVITGTGVIDLAKGRKTPIAVSTIKAVEIQEKGGNFDLPELLVATPSVVTSKEGGYGDMQMTLRGFDQTNTAFLLNGQPINGMEDGKMYWSNWSGIMDIANAVQVQRGLGNSKLAISSVGGTVNIVTKTVDKKEGGFVSGMMANDSYYKGTAYYSTGLMKNGLAVSAMFGHWQGDGYRNGTYGAGQTYFLSFGYKPNDNNIFNFLITGAPQSHGDAWEVSLDTYLTKGRKFNAMYGYKDGEIYSAARNFYHKPIMNLTWDWTINDRMNLSTVAYGSIGRGGYAYPTGALWGKVSGDDGGVDFDTQISDNNAAGESKGYLRGSYNGHNWYGLLANLELDLSDNINVNFGGDVRLYNGQHFRAPTDLLGNYGVNVNHNGTALVVDNVYGGFNPWTAVTNFNNSHEQRVKRDYSENINYYGVFGQIEYAKDKFSTFFQGAVSNQSHERTEYWYVADNDKPEVSDKVSNLGYNVKVGGAYDITEKASVFLNAGYYSRQPFHDNLFKSGSRSNEYYNPATGNETITGIELGYSKNAENYGFNINLYSTDWGNRTKNKWDNTAQELTVFNGVEELHNGIEIDTRYNISDNLKLKAFGSLGDWKYKGIAKGSIYDVDGVDITPGGSTLEIDNDGEYVSGAQITAGLSLDYKFGKGFRFDIGERYYGKNHGDLSSDGSAIDLPGYALLDTGLSYKYKLKGGKSINFRLNVNNLTDEFYISRSRDAISADAPGATLWHGVNIDNRVRLGYGRTWNGSVRFNF